MRKLSSRNDLSYIQMRADPDFKKRFDKICAIKGWSIQTALERILGEWMDNEIPEINPGTPRLEIGKMGPTIVRESAPEYPQKANQPQSPKQRQRKPE